MTVRQADTIEPPAIGRPARRWLIFGGIAVIAAALGLGYLLLINVVVGLAEPGHLTGVDEAFVAAELLFDLLLLATGIAALACTNGRRLRLLGALAAATAADLALALLLYPGIVAEECAAARSDAAMSGKSVVRDCGR